VFNQTFNNPGISVIKYDVTRDGVTAPTKTININGENIEVLTDENDNIVFVVCARGDSSDLWIHFLKKLKMEHLKLMDMVLQQEILLQFCFLTYHNEFVVPNTVQK
jgi:hypothetical protein